MAKDKDVRPIIKLKSTAGTGFTYVTKKNRRNDPDRITLKKYDPVVRKHVEFREEQLVDPASTAEQKEEARLGLQKLPRNASPVRVRSRDLIDGRPRGVLSKFGVSRVRFRQMAHKGELPGITKSSW